MRPHRLPLHSPLQISIRAMMETGRLSRCRREPAVCNGCAQRGVLQMSLLALAAFPGHAHRLSYSADLPLVPLCHSQAASAAAGPAAPAAAPALASTSAAQQPPAHAAATAPAAGTSAPATQEQQPPKVPPKGLGLGLGGLGDRKAKKQPPAAAAPAAASEAGASGSGQAGSEAQGGAAASDVGPGSGPGPAPAGAKMAPDAQKLADDLMSLIREAGLGGEAQQSCPTVVRAAACHAGLLFPHA